MKSKKSLYYSVILILSFILWTVIVTFTDVKSVGPQGSKVGMATVNTFIHALTGVNISLYTITDWLSLIPRCIVVVFGLLGCSQLIKRKSLFKVDYDIIFLGFFYIAVLAAYLLFEVLAVNYRPVLIEGVLEVSYPSSTTVLVLCVMCTAIYQFNRRIVNRKLKKAVIFFSVLFTVFMVSARFISGVHWFSDIIGGIFLSIGLVSMYIYLAEKQS